MGMLSRKIAFESGIRVKSFSEPPTASRKSLNKSRNEDLENLELSVKCDMDRELLV